MRRVFAVAWADLRRRLRSRSTGAVLAATVLLGLLAGVDSFELAFRTSGAAHYVGRPTAAVVGLETGVAGAYLVVLGGYFLLRGRLAADHRLGVTRVTATTPVSEAATVFGKWLSHVAVVGLALVALAATATVTHARSGVGSADPLAVFGPVLLFGLPVAGFVAGVTLLFESTETLSGTLGSVVYLAGVLGTFVLGVSTHAGAPATPATLVAATDLYGTVAAGQATADALAAVAPAYTDGSPGLFSRFLGLPTGASQSFDYRGGGVPAWALAQRAGVFAVGVGLALVATIPYDRWRPVASDDDGAGRLGGVVRRLRGGVAAVGSVVGGVVGEAVGGVVGDGGAGGSTGDTAVESVPRVTRRGSASVWRLFRQELRGKLRGRSWWWYLGVVVVLVGTVVSLPRRQFVAVAVAWPVFVWSSLGIRATHRSRAALVHSSPAAFRQLLAEWAVGVCVAAVVCLPAVLLGGGVGGSGGAGLAGVVADGRLLAAVAVLVFPASVALASGVLTGTPRVFEGGYLLVCYVGPLNVAGLDFAGASTAALSSGAPGSFVAVGAVALAVAVAGKRSALG
ncbi:hypothetical protein [Halobaculum sp. MBLA0143]|uniref:hypothetical protein n=1 Tax=Halobaculum sp. MBLA0143 TaxID=3079933 RepID=UPI003525CDA5